jgi:hypothetical protein
MKQKIQKKPRNNSGGKINLQNLKKKNFFEGDDIISEQLLKTKDFTAINE